MAMSKYKTELDALKCRHKAVLAENRKLRDIAADRDRFFKAYERLCGEKASWRAVSEAPLSLRILARLCEHIRDTTHALAHHLGATVSQVAETCERLQRSGLVTLQNVNAHVCWELTPSLDTHLADVQKPAGPLTALQRIAADGGTDTEVGS